MGKASSTIQSLIRRASSRYTAGPRVNHARLACEHLAADGINTVVCYWNNTFESPVFIAQSYLRLVDLIRDLPVDSYLSVKAPALNFDLELLKKVFEEAQRINATVHFDAMAPETVDRTLDLIDNARRIYPKLGYTLPGRWRRSLADVDRVIDMGLRVRVVKGEWRGLNGDESDPRDGFLRVVQRLASSGARHVAVATHNIRVAHQSLQLLKAAGTSCELELLFGLPQRALLKIAAEHGVTARVYVPYGRSGLPYRLKEAARDPRILSWFVRDLVAGPPT
jgi:proline dehydrogenase